MPISRRSIVGGLLPVSWFLACGGGSGSSSDVRDAGSSSDVTVADRDAAASGDDTSLDAGGDATLDCADASPDAPSEGSTDAMPDAPAAPGDGGGAAGGGADGGDPRPCNAGLYEGDLEGFYWSRLVDVFLDGPDAGAVKLPIVGDTQMTLEPMGSAQQVCFLDGHSEDCSQVFSIEHGTIKGAMDGVFPFQCAVTGTLDCKEKKLVDGWITCVYCVGFPLLDGGVSCLIDSPASQGAFAGPLTADYLYGAGNDAGSPSFGAAPLPAILSTNLDAGDPGTWNGAESLAGYSGAGPLPQGGALPDYLSDAGYGRIGVAKDFGGIGFWNATYQKP